ncbi:MAG: tyrosine-type recombinase/integrase [Candidatus Omnitrophica bacterium]|nr:tyrosine-type recombinase/integrase [Candidatus Omnitrophota bacterium]
MSINIKDFLKECRTRGLTDHTTETYKSNVACFLDFVGDPLDVDIPILRKFLDYLREDMVYTVGKKKKKGVSPRTLNAYFSAIRTYYDYLIIEGDLETNPILAFRKRYLTNHKQKTNGDNSRQLISIDQMIELISSAEEILHITLMLVLAKTGIRKGELLAMDIDDLNLGKGEIIIKPKAKRTNRLLFIDKETVLALKQYLEWRKPRAKCKALWISPMGQRMHKDDPYDIITTYAMKLGLHDPDGSLNKKFTPHCFRHWFTTHLKRAGMEREFIQELRGDSHEDAFDIYNHIDPQDLKEDYLDSMPVLGISLEDGAKMAKETGFKSEFKHHMAKKAKTDQPLKGLNVDLYSLISDTPGLKPVEIAKHFNKKPNDIRSYLHRLEKKGLICKDNYSRCFIISHLPDIENFQGMPDMEACHAQA